jgi:hypothetical protein
MKRDAFDDPDDQVTSPAPRETMAEVQDGRPVVGRWYWFCWEPVKATGDWFGETALGAVTGIRPSMAERRLEPLTYQHVDFVQVRWQRQTGGPMAGQTAALAEMRAQLAEDRFTAAMQPGGPTGDPNWQRRVWEHIDRRPLLRRIWGKAWPYLLAVAAGVLVAIAVTALLLRWL